MHLETCLHQDRHVVYPEVHQSHVKEATFLEVEIQPVKHDLTTNECQRDYECEKNPLFRVITW